MDGVIVEYGIRMQRFIEYIVDLSYVVNEEEKAMIVEDIVNDSIKLADGDDVIHHVLKSIANLNEGIESDIMQDSELERLVEEAMVEVLSTMSSYDELYSKINRPKEVERIIGDTMVINIR